MFSKVYPPYLILSAFFLSFIIAALNDFFNIAIAFSVSLIVLFASNFSILKNLKKMSFVSSFLIFLCLMIIFTYGNETLFKFYFVSIYKEGLILSFKIFLKSLSILFIFLSFVGSMSISLIAASLKTLKVPSDFIFLLVLSFIHIFFIKNEYKKIKNMLKVRGFKGKTNIHSYKTYAYVAGMLFIRALKKGEVTYKAMLCRGFNGTFYDIYELNLNKKSYLFLVFITIFSFFLIFF